MIFNRFLICVMALASPIPGSAFASASEDAAAMHSGTRDLFVRYGAISDTGHLSAFPAEKIFILGMRQDWNLLTYQYELGGIFDGRADAKSSAFVTFSAGLETKSRPFYIYYLPGLALITGPDAYLSSVYQFSHDVGGGIKDARGVSIDFTYRHFSNAGIVMPNPGRNYLILKMGIPMSAVGL